MEEGLERKIEEKRKTFTEAEAKEQILKKFYDLARNEMYRYLNSRKRSIIAIFENLWDKYNVPLDAVSIERETSARKLHEYLEALGYFK